MYRLIKHADARRVLFLVDRRTLGKQAFTEFTQYVTPDNGRKFTELYNVQHLTSNKLDSVSQVCITTIQRLHSMLTGQTEFAEENEEQSFYAVASQTEQPVAVSYNSALPRGWELYSNRLDKDWGAIDCISFAIMQERNLTETLTSDHHFEQAGFKILL